MLYIEEQSATKARRLGRLAAGGPELMIPSERRHIAWLKHRLRERIFGS
ncbi:MAG: hypothetical protein V2A77_10460 [Pseudomonadota bacterium]